MKKKLYALLIARSATDVVMATATVVTAAATVTIAICMMTG